jgi:hypothetical protein
MSPQSSKADSTSLILYWEVPIVREFKFQYLPSINEVNSNVWTNNSNWLNATMYEFKNLKSYTLYNMTVYVRTIGSDKKDGYPPSLYQAMRTAEAG